MLNNLIYHTSGAESEVLLFGRIFAVVEDDNVVVEVEDVLDILAIL